MPLSEEIIDDCYERYIREYDRYSKMAEFVAEKCREFIGDTIPSSVTWRAKEPRKLKSKLKHKYQNDPNLNCVDDVFDRIGDLAGVRISTYQEAGRAQAEVAIEELFEGINGDEVQFDRKDLSQSIGHYRATHCQVCLDEQDTSHNRYANLKGISCEVQICSMLAHVWNEIEHDLVYKPEHGALTESELSLLSDLGSVLRVQDNQIRALFDSIDRRRKERTDSFQDLHDFVVRIREKFPRCESFELHSEDLYADLMALNLDTPEKIESTLLIEEHYEEYGIGLYQALQDRLLTLDDSGVSLSHRTSDVLLMLLLYYRLEDVLALHPMGRGKGRPSRIARIASRYKDYRDYREKLGAPLNIRETNSSS